MILGVMALALVTIVGVASPASAPAGSHPPLGVQTETLWRGVLRGDSLFVRAAWIPTVGSASCLHETTDADTSEVRRKYVEYRIEDSHGAVWDRGVLSEPDSQQFCCDQAFAEATLWPGRLVIKLTAFGWYCEPAGACSDSRFIYLAGSDSVAASAWTDIPWDPATGSSTNAWVTESCIQYGMKLEARVHGTRLDFDPVFPPGVNEGDLLEKGIDKDEEFGDCLQPFRPKKPTTVAWYPSPDSKSPRRLIIGPDESVEVMSAVVRATRSDAGKLVPSIVRLGVQVSGRRGFLTRADLRSLGFLGL